MRALAIITSPPSFWSAFSSHYPTVLIYCLPLLAGELAPSSPANCKVKVRKEKNLTDEQADILKYDQT